MRDVPRNALGWPTIEPAFFTLPQLLREARKWRSGYLDPSAAVAYGEWVRYTDELLRRQYSTRTEIQEGMLPDEVQRREQPLWWRDLEND